MAVLPADLRSRLVAAAERRLPALTRLRQAEALPIRLDRRRIYVLPTRFGLLFAALLFVMLLGALNYANNPALLLTCLLGAAAGISVFFGFRAMSGLALTRVRIDEAHADAPVVLQLGFDAGNRARAGLRVRRGAAVAVFAAVADAETRVEVPIEAATRGRFRPGRIRLSTEWPLGLFELWSWVHPDAEFIIWPAVERPAPPLPAGTGERGERAEAGADEEQAGLRDYRSGDPARLIAWKPSVRHDTLLVRDAERRAGSTLVLDYAALSGLDHEARIRRLTAWLLAANAERRTSTLQLPDETIGPGLGEGHRQACLRALALLPAASTRDGSA